MEDQKSTHRCEVVRLKFEVHPNADSLYIVHLFNGGFQVCCRKDSYPEGDGSLAVFVPPDSLVPLDHPEFEWLKETGRSPKELGGKLYHRVTAIKLRKAPSMGFLFPAPKGAVEGQDLAPLYGILHYEPPQKGLNIPGMAGGPRPGFEKKPSSQPPGYDLESMRRYSEVFSEGETVYVTEKIHGANARYTWEDRGLFSLHKWGIRLGNLTVGFRGFQKMPYIAVLPWYARFLRVGSRNNWRHYDPKDSWWKAAEGCPELILFVSRYHGAVTLYGEIYGNVQDLDYGAGQEIKFAAFDVFDNKERKWWDPGFFFERMRNQDVPTVPFMGAGPFDMAGVLKMAEGPTKLWHGPEGSKPHIREGVVVKPFEERQDPLIGRVALKVVGQGYLEKAEA